MNRKDNIVDTLKTCPYKLPENYVSNMEDRVRKAIKEEEYNEEATQKGKQFPGLAIVKSNFAMLFSFIFIFAIGYGIIKIATPKEYLNNTTTSNTVASADSALLKQNQAESTTDEASRDEAIEDYLIESGLTVAVIASLE